MIYDKYLSNLTLDVDAAKGSFQDQSANGCTTVVGGTPQIVNTEMGRAFELNGVDAEITVPATAITSEQMTLSSWVKIKESQVSYFFVGRTGDPYFAALVSSTGLQVQSAAGGTADQKMFFDFADDKWHHIVTTRDGDDHTKIKIYLDGIKQTTLPAGNIATGTSFSMYSKDSANFLKGQSTGAKVWNTILTEQDVAELYEEELTRHPQTAVDIKSTGNYVNFCADGDMLKTGTDDWTLDGDGAIAKDNDATRGQVMKVTNDGDSNSYADQYPLLQNKNYRMRGWYKSDGAASARAKLGAEWAFVASTSTSWAYFDTGCVDVGAASNIKLGSLSGAGDTFYSDIEVFECEPDGTPKYTETYIADGKGWNESVANVTSGQLENTGFNVESGTWQVEDNSGFDKVISCISTGHVSMPMNQIYGTWEFYLNHHDLANTFVTFMSDNTELTPSNGYSLITLSTEAIRFREYNPGVTNHFTSSIGTAIPDAWEKYTITRATDGTFSVYLNDVLVNTDGGGSNPVLDNTITTCSHLVLSFGTGDKIRDFKFIPYIQ